MMQCIDRHSRYVKVFVDEDTNNDYITLLKGYEIYTLLNVWGYILHYIIGIHMVVIQILHTFF